MELKKTDVKLLGEEQAPLDSSPPRGGAHLPE